MNTGTRQRSRRDRQQGLTLLEVMVVLAIIALVAGLSAPRLMENFGRAKSRTATVKMESLRTALQLYYIDNGRYPSEAEGLQALLVAPQGLQSWQGPYVDGEESLSDPWGRAFGYRSPADTKAFEISTYGRDGRAGGTSEDRDISL
jgi:general secretion pathway protein G